MNKYEFAARELKVDAILAVIPQGASKEHNDRTAEWMATWSQEDRNLLARKAGQNVPSEKTWALVIEGLRNRKA